MNQEPKEVVRRLIALLNDRRYSELDEVLAPSRRRFVPYRGSAVARFFDKLSEVLPDHRVVEQSLIVEGDRVALLASVSGTPSGRFLKVAPTGRHVAFRTMHAWRVIDGRLAEHIGATDLFGLLLQLGVAPGNAVTPEPIEYVDIGPTGPGEVKAVARRFHEGASESAGVDVRSLLSIGYVDHTPYNFEGRTPGVEGRLRAVEMVRSAFSDFTRTVDLQIAESDLVVSVVTDTGTHTGAFLGTKPTGKSVRLLGMNLERVKKGLVEESWHVEDMTALARQLGIV